MIDIDFVKGANRSRLPKFLKKARMTQRLAVVQHADDENSDGRVFDWPFFWAMLNFVSDYDPTANIFVAEKWEHVDVKERPFSDLVEQWRSAPQEKRFMPAAFLLRKGDKLRLCLICDIYDLDDPWPYTASYSYSLLSDRDISEDVLTYLRTHEQAPRIIRNENTGSRPSIRNRTRENTELPKRAGNPFWVALLVVAFCVIPLGAMGIFVHTAREAYAFTFLAILSIGLVLFTLLSEFRDIDVQLSWDGIRKGAKFIAWDEARLETKEGKVVVRSKTRKISLWSSHFVEQKFWIFFRLIRREIEARGLARVDKGEIISTTPYALSKNDLKSFNRYGGKGSGKTIFSMLYFYGMPLLASFSMANIFWNDPQRRRLPHILQYPVVYIALAGLCTALVCGVWFLCFWLSYRERRKNTPRGEITVSLSEVGLVFHGAKSRSLEFWHEIPWVVQSRTLILFFTRPGLATIVPKRIFASPAEAAEFYDRALAFKRAYTLD